MSDNQAATAELLLAMTAEEFEKIVVSQLNHTRRAPEIYEALMSAHVIVRTKEALDILRVRSQDAMQAKRADLAAFQARCTEEGPDGRLTWLKGKGERMQTIRKSGHFLKLVEAMQVEAKRGIRNARIATQESRAAEKAVRRAEDGPKAANRRGTLWTLVGALIAHEEAQYHNCTAEDEKLWDLLDSMTCLWDGETLSLREAYQSGWS